MFIPSVQNIGFLVFVTLSALTLVLAVYDVSVELEPKGPLGVALDYPLATAWPPRTRDKSTNNVRRNWVYSSHLKFKDSVDDIADEQLWQMARDAATEMAEERKQYKIEPAREPAAMGIMAWGNEIILASSQKDTSFSYRYSPSPVLESLRLCQAVWKDHVPSPRNRNHKSGAMCAELIAAQLYYATATTNLQKRNARVGTWVRDENGDWKQRDPCGAPKEDLWGCDLFTTDQNLTVIDSKIDPEDYDLDEVAGGVETVDQIQLWEGPGAKS